MDRQIRRLALAMGLLFALVFAQINYLQVFASSRLANNPANPRLIIQEFNIDRGEILARDHRTVLATSVATHGRLKFLRRYPQGSLYGLITGFDSLVFGRTRLEATYNDFLDARATELVPSTILDEILDRPRRGATVVTTIDPKLQRTAFTALSQAISAHGTGGGLAAVDPRTGEVLALVGIPSFDPNPLSGHSTRAIQAAMKRLNPSSPDTPLLSQASDQLFPPGSTFKLIDTAAALQNGLTPQTQFANPTTLKLPQTTHRLHNFGGAPCLGGAPKISLFEALTISCDVTFAELGLQLGGAKLRAQADAFGFDGQVPFDIPFNEGSFPDPASFTNDLPGLAFSAIGQQDVKANPLQMALVASAIANGGAEMQPRLVSEILNPSGVPIKTFGPTLLGNPISSSTAQTMTQMMVSVVQRGTGTLAQIPGVQVAGKTGTAEVGTKTDAWFVGFAPASHPQIAVVAVVLNVSGVGNEVTGGRVAAPVVRTVIQAALQGNG